MFGIIVVRPSHKHSYFQKDIECMLNVIIDRR